MPAELPVKSGGASNRARDAGGFEKKEQPVGEVGVWGPLVKQDSLPMIAAPDRMVKDFMKKFCDKAIHEQKNPPAAAPLRQGDPLPRTEESKGTGKKGKNGKDGKKGKQQQTQTASEEKAKKL